MNPQDPSQDPSRKLAAAPSAEVRASLSALTDGEADLQAASAACAAWRDDPAARAVWHRYQLIGDVMRSAELASPAAHDAAFLSALRARLAAEPVVLAPAPLLRPTPAEAGSAAQMVRTAQSAQTAKATQRRFGWRAPTAAVAGFAAVAGVLLVMRMATPADPAGAPVQVRAPGAAEYLLTGTAAAGVTPSVSAGVIRDARLDAYLSAHQAARVRGVAAVPGGALRQVDGMMTVGAER